MTCSGASSDFKRLTKRENATVRGVVSAYCKVCDKPIYRIHEEPIAHPSPRPALEKGRTGPDRGGDVETGKSGQNGAGDRRRSIDMRTTGSGSHIRIVRINGRENLADLRRA